MKFLQRLYKKKLFQSPYLDPKPQMVVVNARAQQGNKIVMLAMGARRARFWPPLLCRRVVMGLRLPYARPRRYLYYII